MLDYKNYFEDFKSLLFELAVIPSATFCEQERALFCRKTLLSYGCEGVYKDGLHNVMYPYNCENTNDIFVVSAHTDTVFSNDIKRELTYKDNLVFCPGIGDDTVSLAAVMTAARAVAENKPKLPFGIIFSCVSREEGLGNFGGARELMNRYGARVKGFVSFDGSKGWIAENSVVSSRYTVCVKEHGGHSLWDFGNASAIASASRLITMLYSQTVPQNGDIATFNVGLINGGTSVNAIASSVEFSYEIRSDTKETTELLKNNFEDIIGRFRPLCLGLEVSLVTSCQPSTVDKSLQKAFVKHVADAYEKSGAGEYKTVSIATDCNIPLSLGIPAVAVGAFAMGNTHNVDEWLDLNGLQDGLKAVFSIVNELLFS